VIFSLTAFDRDSSPTPLLDLVSEDFEFLSRNTTVGSTAGAEQSHFKLSTPFRELFTFPIHADHRHYLDFSRHYPVIKTDILSQGLEGGRVSETRYTLKDWNIKNNQPDEKQ
jgi:hypothetical protein